MVTGQLTVGVVVTEVVTCEQLTTLTFPIILPASCKDTNRYNVSTCVSLMLINNNYHLFEGLGVYHIYNKFVSPNFYEISIFLQKH